MAVQFRDYYETLGVSKSATTDEIRSAFRKLARKDHPDVAKDKKVAEEKFKQINEAYEVLSDPEKRQKYDQLGENWNQPGGFQPPPQWGGRQPGGFRWGSGENGGVEFEFGGTGFSDFFEAFFGGGRGRSAYGGFGQRGAMAERGDDVEADIMVTLEEALHGSTRQVSLRRAGSKKTETYQVKIPRGVREGQRIRLAGQGEAGEGGGKSGDLFLRVRSRWFQIEGKSKDLTRPTWTRGEGFGYVRGRAAGRLPAFYSAGSGSGCAWRMRTWNCFRWLRQRRSDGGEQSARGALRSVLEFGKRAAFPAT